MSYEPVWQRLGFDSEADYTAIERATKCDVCGGRLAKYARFRIRRAGNVPDFFVCPKHWDLAIAHPESVVTSILEERTEPML